MQSYRDALKPWLDDAPKRLAEVGFSTEIEHIGTVMRVGDDVATIAGLPKTRLGELMRFEDGTLAMALSIEEQSIECVLLGESSAIAAGAKVRGSGEVARTPVGPGLLGRVVDGLGRPLDGKGEIVAERHDPIERPAPGILHRDLITEPLLTGLTVVDAMIPLGRGQRTLILGDRKTGKTALAIDTIINQRTTDVVCVYALIGQKSSTVEQVIDAVTQHGKPEQCIFVVGEASAPPVAQWLVPYAACAMAEYFRDKGQHALLVLDDLTKHAIAYRQMSLLLRRPPGREAYPGDIFYIHSRLLERAAKLSAERGGGSLTALPIIETEAGNLSAYIPTNLISITDGQVYFEPKLFYEGHKPAVNVGLSVSRVGAKTQPPVIRDAAGRLKLDYAQFVELEVFTRFGAMVDSHTKARIEHGRRIRAILAQSQFDPRSLAVQTALLLAVQSGKLDALDFTLVDRFKNELKPRLEEACPQVVARVEQDLSLSDDDRTRLLSALDAIIAAVSKTPASGRPEAEDG